MPRIKKLTDYTYSPTNPASEDAIRAQIDDSIQEVYDASSRNDVTVNLTGNQTISDVKTFSSSPIVPDPTTDFQVANKKGVDTVQANLNTHKTSTDHDGRYYTETEVNALLLANQQGNHLGTWQGYNPVQTDPGIQSIVNTHTRQITDFALNVKDFGAIGDGVNDDTTSIQNTINSAGVSGRVYFPKGTYLISSPITPLAYQEIYGVTRQGSQITTNESIKIFDLTANKNGVEFRNLYINGNNVATDGIFLVDCNFGGIVENCNIINVVGTGLNYSANCYSNKIKKNFINNCGLGVRVGDNSSDFNVDDNIIVNSGSAIVIECTNFGVMQQIRIQDNNWETCDYGITITVDSGKKLSNISILGNRSEGVALAEIKTIGLGTIDNLIISGNYLEGKTTMPYIIDLEEGSTFLSKIEDNYMVFCSSSCVRFGANAKNNILKYNRRDSNSPTLLTNNSTFVNYIEEFDTTTTPPKVNTKINYTQGIQGTDLEFLGGYKQTLQFFKDDVPANQNAVILSDGFGGTNIFVAPYSGSVLQMICYSNTPITAGTITPRFYKNGVQIGVSAQLSISFPTLRQNTYVKDLNSFVSGDLITVRFDSSSDLSPLTADIKVILILEY